MSAALAAPAALRTSWAAGHATTRFTEFDYENVQLLAGPLKEQYDRMAADYVALDNDRLLQAYRERAGLPAPGKRMGGWYDRDGFVPGHTFGQYVSGLARMAKTRNDAQMKAKVQALVHGLAETMAKDDKLLPGENAEKLWPCYILDKHLQGFVDAYRFCGIDEARELIPRLMHGAQPYLPAVGRDRIGKKDPPYDETFIMPETLFDAYELTGDKALYDRAVLYLLDKELFDPLARGVDVFPGQHAYSHVIAMSSAGKAHLVLGDEKYLRAMQTAFRLLRDTQQYATGGWGPNETFITPHRGELYESLRSTEDHFETPCGSYATIKLARYLLCATGDAQYGDGLERVLYNALLAVREPDSDGDYPYYSTYGPQARKVYYKMKWPCCSGTLIEGVADYVKDIYFRMDRGVAVNLYTPSKLSATISGALVEITQKTAYPLEETVRIEVCAKTAASFTLALRLPAWLQEKAEIRVNGKAVNAGVERGFALLTRRWTANDVVELHLPMRFRTEAIDDKHEETVAVLRGPLVYVEMNPRTDVSPLDPLEKRTVFGNGYYRGGEGVHAPFYFVREESYTTYFTKRS